MSGFLEVPKAALKAQQSPVNKLKTRVWATLILHSTGYQSEIALRHYGGERVPMTSAHIASELQKVAAKYYKGAGIREPLTDTTREKVRRCLVEMEKHGLIERQPNHGIKVWTNPKAASGCSC